MYKDLEVNTNKILKNDIIQTICGVSNNNISSLGQIISPNELDKKIKPIETFQILDADLSQQQAIQVVKSGANLVIEGPPGTGKSQTIANIISELLAQDKKVLFVSQKIAALDVVKNRLDNHGLSPFCLEIHSNKTNKKRVIEELIKTFENKELHYNGDYNFSLLEDDINKLKLYIDELHTPLGKLGFTPFKAFGIIAKNNDIKDLEFIFNNYANWNLSKYETVKKIITDYIDIIEQLGNPKNFSWFGCFAKELSYENSLELKNKINNITTIYYNLVNQCDKLIAEKYFTKLDTINDLTEVIKISDLLSNIPQTALSLLYKDEAIIKDELYSIFNISKNYLTFLDNFLK